MDQSMLQTISILMGVFGRGGVLRDGGAVMGVERNYEKSARVVSRERELWAFPKYMGRS